MSSYGLRNDGIGWELDGLGKSTCCGGLIVYISLCIKISFECINHLP